MKVLLILSTFFLSLNAFAIDNRLYQAVSATSSATLTLTPSDGQNVNLKELGGFAANSSNQVKIDYDGDLLFVTSGENSRSSSERLIGDGAKVLTITLTNNTVSTSTMGGYFIFNNKRF